MNILYFYSKDAENEKIIEEIPVWGANQLQNCNNLGIFHGNIGLVPTLRKQERFGADIFDFTQGFYSKDAENQKIIEEIPVWGANQFQNCNNIEIFHGN